MDQPQVKKGIVRRLYDWVLHWADTKYGTPALATLSFAESSFFPVPPDVLLIALSIGKPKKSFYYALVCSIASVVGGICGYMIGWGLWEVVKDIFFNYIPGFSPAAFEMIKGKYDAYNFWIVFIAGFTPIPYKLITISGGVFGINFPIFVIASVVSRSSRFFLVSAMIYFFGEKIKSFIDKYFNLLSIAFMVLLILGFIAIKYLF